jgi:hypothetical protein
MIYLYTIAFIVVLIGVFIYPIYKNKKITSALAEEKWEEEDKTIFVRYGNFDIPILHSQLTKWNAMSNNEKWWMLSNLQAEVKSGKLTTERIGNITRFIGITNKAKDIKHRQKQRTEGWKNSPEKN